MATERRGNKKQICLEGQLLRADNDSLRHEIEKLKRFVAENSVLIHQEEYLANYKNDLIPAEMKLADRC